MATNTLAKQLAQWVVDLDYSDIPSDTLLHVKRCLLDNIGVQLRGSILPWVRPAYEYARSTSTPSSDHYAAVSYYGDRMSAEYAAFANSAFSYSCELQHHGAPRSAHPGVIVIPTAMAIAEELDINGRDLATAIVAGYEVQGRLGAAAFDAILKNHFHPQGVLGVFSATAVAGKLLGLNSDKLAHAFGIAGSYASSILEYDHAGGEVKRIHGSMAARNGIQSAKMAELGLTGPLTVFEGENGVFSSFADGNVAVEGVLEEIGYPFCISHCRFRVYPTIGACHNSLDIVHDLLATHDIDYKQIDAIAVQMNPEMVAHVASVIRPHDVISAQASLGYSIATLLVMGDNDLDRYFSAESWANPIILGVADKVAATALEDPANLLMTRLQIKFKDGQLICGEQIEPRGSESSPFPTSVLEAKFRALVEPVLGRARANVILESLQAFETLDSLRELTPMLQRTDSRVQ